MGTERILVVEDEPRVAQAVCRALALPEGGGHQVKCCESGEAAIECVRAAHFDLLITDLRMTGMNGLELLEQVHVVSPTTRTILITAFGTPSVEERARRLADVYLPKPFKMRSLIEIVQHTLTAAPTVPHRLIAFSEQGLRAVQQRIDVLRIDLGALGALLLDQSGQLLTEAGQRGDLDSGVFLPLLGNAMAASNEVVHILGDREAFTLHYHEGSHHEIYAARITHQILLALVLERHGNAGRIGMVWMYLRRAITELRELLERAVVVSGPPLGGPIQTAVDSALDRALGLAENAPPAQAAVPDASFERSALLSYEEANALGLINLDTLETDSRPDQRRESDNAFSS